jgi:hypothetical protein
MFLLIPLCVTACKKGPSKAAFTQYTLNLPREWELLSETNASKVAIPASTTIHGLLSEVDRGLILDLVGRIKGAGLTVDEIDIYDDTLWTVGARVTLPEFIAYCIKMENGEWEISKVVFRHVN